MWVASNADDGSVSRSELDEPSAVLLRLQETLTSCSKSIETGDFRELESSVSKLVELLDSIFDAAALDPNNEEAKNNTFEVLSEIHRYICSPSSDQAVIDALSFELPKAVAKFAGLSNEYMEIAQSLMDKFIAICSPRDMLSILCEALDTTSMMLKSSGYLVILLSGLSKVFLSIQRHHFEQLKVALPVILNVLKAVSSESDDGDLDSGELFDRAIGFANSVHAVCLKLEGRVNEKLGALLGLCILQIMTLVTVTMRNNFSSCLPLVVQLSHFFPYCGLSYIGLITGCDVDRISSIALGEDEDNYWSCLSHVKHGASLSVIWGQISVSVAHAAEELTSVKDELRSNQIKRWQAIGMLKHIFVSANLPWELKKHAIEFLLCITDGSVSQSFDDGNTECYMPSLFASLQAVEMVIIYTSDPVLRKNAFDAFKRVLADIPSSQRFDILKALIRNCDTSAMVAILMDIVKSEMNSESLQGRSLGNENDLEAGVKAVKSSVFWSAGILELVELVLRPPKGGPPSLPEESDSVLSALNLYRFVLIRESTGKTNYTGVLCKNNLLKSYNEWLLPLRTLVTGTMAENKTDYDQLAVDTVCAINPVELVLYRCIELVEEQLKHSS